ncbi:type I-E CRISPR-associated protein Cse2/CasB [Thermoproteota archaeon]
MFESDIVFHWWQNLEQERGDRAKLRRAGSLSEICFIPVFHDLYRQLKDANYFKDKNIALVAGVLSHIRVNSDIEFPHELALKKVHSDSPVVSGLRFQRLIKNETPEELFHSIIRVIHLLGNKANVRELAESLYWWNEKARIKWAFKYYEKAHISKKN